ncbi:MAG: DNA mismatch repair protein MutS [Clostridium sp.]|uniref:MutS-related protein n=1 Tax=Clostridium sp. TaxID=1506 RepID=UPI0030311309
MKNSLITSFKFFLNRRKINILKSDYLQDNDKTHNFKDIRKLFDIRPKTEYFLDEQSFNDLDLTSVYKKINKTYTTAGEASLYSLLRNIITDEITLNNRSDLINFFKTNESERIKLQLHFFNMGFDNKNSFIEMLETYLNVNKSKYYLYTFLGKILPLIIILTALFTMNVKFMLVLGALLWINAFINMVETKNIKDTGLIYLRKLIVISKKINNSNIPELQKYTTDIDYILKNIKIIDKGTRVIGLSTTFDGLFEVISVPFLLEESTYYNLSSQLTDNKDLILNLYYIIGEIEALISISSYQSGLKASYTKPKFSKDITLNISNGIHPLVNNPVSNSIKMDKHGIILTGTNMSGKSTFLRMLGINIVFAQSFNFVLAKSYESCFFNVVSSISPNDDVTTGKSYYMAEAESLLRIIKATEKPLPIFCAVDEIFRGTNPVERIAASAEILKYINSKKVISIVATHDRELADILKNNYDFFYFSETVDNNDGLSFDYKLKKGVSQTKNAIKLLKYIGYPEEIVVKSFERAKHIEGFI